MNGMNYDSKEAVDQNCEGCAMDKQHHQLFPKKAKSITIGFVEIIRSNVC